MKSDQWEITEGQGPIAATAIHDGHELRAEVLERSGLTDLARLREEDPYTGALTSVVDTRIVVRTSRFEFDLNRCRDHAVYIDPEDAWGLSVWKESPAPEIIERSLRGYDAFYAEAKRIFSAMEQRFGRFIVLDLHSYNHQRGGPGAPFDDPEQNPEVNVGTGSLDRERWGLLVDRFIGDLAAFDFRGRHLDVRENVKFRGGNLSRWIHANFPASACCLAIEFKKFFMDEWTGTLDERQGQAIHHALESTVPGVLEELQKLGVKAG